MQTDLQLITEINIVYGYGVLDGIGARSPRTEKFKFRHISKSAFVDQFKQGLKDGRNNG